MEMNEIKTIGDNPLNAVNNEDHQPQIQFKRMSSRESGPFVLNDTKSKENELKEKQAEINHSYNKSPNIQVNYIPANHMSNTNIQSLHKTDNHNYPIPNDQSYNNNQDIIQYNAQPHPNEQIPIGLTYYKPSNHGLIMIVEHKQNRLDPQTAYYPFPMHIAVMVLIINIIIPGIGTILSSYYMSTPQYQKSYFCTGVCQLITAILLLGWVLGIYNGVVFIRAAGKKVSVEEYYSK